MEAHDLAGRARVGRFEVDAWNTPAEWFFRGEILQDDFGAQRRVCKIDDDIGPFSPWPLGIAEPGRIGAKAVLMAGHDRIVRF